jgi:hypothetical protein
VVDWDNDEHDQPLWSDFKEIFKQEYTVQTNKRLILEGLANLAMEPNEMTNELLTKITRMVKVIKESFADYGAITLDPLNDIKTIHKHDVQLLQNEFVQGRTEAGTQSSCGTTRFRSHDSQEDVHVHHQSPMRGQNEATSLYQ